MKKLFYCLPWLLVGIACTSDDEVVVSQPTPSLSESLPIATIDHTIRTLLDKQGEFAWDQATTDLLWSAAVQSDSVLFVGYQPSNIPNVDKNLHTITIADPAWTGAKEVLIDELLTIINRTATVPINRETLVVDEGAVLPYIAIKTDSYEAVAYLRENTAVRYVEPASYFFQTPAPTPNQRTADKLICDYDDNVSLPVPPEDYQATVPNAKIPWNFLFSNIAQAWSLSTGAGVTVGLIDTGISPDQAKLGSAFNEGLSQNRMITKLGTYENDGSGDPCGHGTRMAGLIAAPRGNDGTAVGVAYNANLISFRGTADVIVDSRSEKQGVVDALVALANQAEVRIISMSIGNPLSSGTVADAVRYAYGKQKLIVCAAGTSTSFTNWAGVVFPARMDETVAVTGLKDNSNYVRCSNCHSGSTVDFTMVMQRAVDTERTSLTLTRQGNDLSFIGGSSTATAMVAGVAALVWSQNPSFSREDVLQRLRESADFYPKRDQKFGWGTVDAYRAVAGAGAIAQGE